MAAARHVPHAWPAAVETVCRSHYKDQLSTIHATRQSKLMSLSNPRGSGGFGASGALSNAAATHRLPGRGTLPALATATLRPAINESVKEGSEARKLDKFEKVERDWAAAASGLASTVRRPEFDLAMQRGVHTEG
jgi:hypothetical protein